MTHRNATSNFLSLSGIYPCHHDSRMLQFSALSFDVSAFEIFWTFHNAMTLCVAPKDLLLDRPNEVANRLKVTHLSLTPTAVGLFDRSKLEYAQVLITAGERSNEKIIQEWVADDFVYYNSYGPTETTNVITSNRMQKGSHVKDIGTTLPGNRCIVVSAGLHVLPRGCIGELCFFGSQIVWHLYFKYSDIFSFEAICKIRNGLSRNSSRPQNTVRVIGLVTLVH